MNSSIVFHSADPEAIQSGYTAFDNCDFVINVGEGRSLVRNSVRLVGDLQINSTGTTRTLGEIYMDYRIGAHAMLDSLQVTFGGPGGGVKQNTQNYARWVSMTTAAEQSQADMLNASNQVELRAPNQLSVERYADGESTGTTQNIISNLDFAVKPNCILNKMVGDHLPFEKSGEIRLTINLAKNQSALMGAKQGSGANYEITGLRCLYQSVETIGDPMATSTTMRNVQCVKTSIQSATANISAQVPAVADACHVSFQRQDRENANCFNNYQLAQVPNIRRVQFLWNDSTNKYISYEQNDQNTMLKGFIDSFQNTGHNMVFRDDFRTYDGFALGQHFNGFIDLSRTRFGLQLTTDIDSSRPYNVYMYFSSIVTA